MIGDCRPTRAAVDSSRTGGGGATAGELPPDGNDLVGLFQSEQQLIFRQRLRAATEAVALHLLDDLAQPLVLMTLGNQHRP